MLCLERLVKFEVLGQEYPLYTDAPEEDVQEILHMVKTHLENQSLTSIRLLSDRVAILTCLNMAGEYVKLKRDYEKYKDQIRKQIEGLTRKIEKSL